MSKEEHITEFYQCTIMDFSLAHRSQAGETPTQAFQLKEGDGRERHGKS